MTEHQSLFPSGNTASEAHAGTVHLSNPFLIECRLCAFEPSDQFALPRGSCPKCHASTWHRVLRPGSLAKGTADEVDLHYNTIIPRRQWQQTAAHTESVRLESHERGAP